MVGAGIRVGEGVGVQERVIVLESRIEGREVEQILLVTEE